MKSLAFLIILLQICLYASQIFSESCEKSLNSSNSADSCHQKFLGSDSVIYELVNNLRDIDFESNRCNDELMLIKEGIQVKDVWAFKRK